MIYKQTERPWSERNGGIPDTLDWNGSNTNTSPRKDYLSRSTNIGESWRRSRVEDDNPSGTNGAISEGWRGSGGGTNNLYKWRKLLFNKNFIFNFKISYFSHYPIIVLLAVIYLLQYE